MVELSSAKDIIDLATNIINRLIYSCTTLVKTPVTTPLKPYPTLIHYSKTELVVKYFYNTPLPQVTHDPS